MKAEHQHRCMRCGERFDCQTPGVCVAAENVLPSIVTLENGAPVVKQHCPETPDWAWIRDYGKRMQAQGWDGALAYMALTPEQREAAARAATAALRNKSTLLPTQQSATERA